MRYIVQRPIALNDMLAKRIIPCLDVNAGRVVKGVNFVSLRDAGDPVEIARRYDAEGADELTFLDITASSDQRDIIVEVIEAVANQVFIPLTVGGGVRKVDDVRRLLNAGADKISINTAAVQTPQLVADASARFGSQCIVVAIDARRRVDSEPDARRGPEASGWEVFTHGGRTATGLDAVDWAREVVELGAGEILLTSMDRDGTKLGFDLELTRAVADAVSVPVIASGGVGSLQDLADGVLTGRADAVLAASIFHYGEFTVQQAKQHMASCGIPMRLFSETPKGALCCTHGARVDLSQLMTWLDDVRFNADGLVTVIAQDTGSARVLMVAWANREALVETAASGRAVYWSRSRKRLWRKGEESGHTQHVLEIRLDCDGDVVLYAVEQAGGIACHTGRESCFFRRLDGEQWQTIDPVLKDPELI